MKRNIARDYYASPLSMEELRQKYRVSESYIREAAVGYDFKGLGRRREYSVVKVDKEQLEAALLLLRDASIHHEVPEHFELTEYYQSKLNYDEETL